MWRDRRSRRAFLPEDVPLGCTVSQTDAATEACGFADRLGVGIAGIYCNCFAYFAVKLLPFFVVDIDFIFVVCRFKTRTVAFVKRYVRMETDNRLALFFFQITSSVCPVKTLYSPLAIKSRTFAIVSAKTAANERISKVFSCPVFCNEIS